MRGHNCSEVTHLVVGKVLGGLTRNLDVCSVDFAIAGRVLIELGVAHGFFLTRDALMCKIVHAANAITNGIKGQ